MGNGHIKLDGRSYRVTDPRALVRANANQAATKIAQGAGEYDDLQNWTIWLQDNWQSGIGHKDPTDGPLASTVDTRFKQQLSLPGFLRHITSTVSSVFAAQYANSLAYHRSVTDVSNSPERSDETIGAGQSIGALGWLFVANNVVPTPIEVLLPGIDPGCTQVTVKVWNTDGAGAPTTVEESHDVTLNGRIGWFWHAVAFTTITSGANKEFFVSIEPKTGTLTVPYVITGSPNNHKHYLTGSSTWASNSIIGWMVRYHVQLAGSGGIDHITQFNNITYFARGTRLFKYTSNTITLVDTLPQTITDLLAAGDRLYIGQNVAGNYRHMATNETITAASVPAEKFLLWRGFLWRSAVGRLFYTSDETTWIEILPEVADRGYSIRGLGGHGDDVIVSTDNALYRVGWGDLVQEITNWGAPSSTNGAHMLNFQGDLYISHGSSLLRYDGQSLLPMGPDLGEGLPNHFAGDIVGMASNNNWLLCAVGGTVSSVWIYNGQGWHFTAELPENNTLSSIHYTSDDSLGFSTFLMGNDDATLHSVKIADTLRAMRRVTEGENLTSQYHAWTGFLETDWFYGNLRELQKDVESLYVDGEQLGDEPHVKLYWQDELSNEWEELGQTENDSDELRFTNEGRRPACKRIKIGILLFNNFHLHTPVVSAIRLKYRPMIIDRWRWQVPIEVKDNQEMIDGTTNPRNAAQMLHELDTLTKQVPPARFQDLDDEEYEVMVLNGSRQAGMVRWNPHANSGAGGKEIHWIYNLTLEQVSADNEFIGIVDPTEIAGLWGWWDFSDATTMYTTSDGSTKVSADGDPVGRIEDKSGNARHISQATSSLRPIYRKNIHNFWSAGQFAFDLLVTDALATIDPASVTLAVVFSSSAYDGQGGIMGMGDSLGDTVAITVPAEFLNLNTRAGGSGTDYIIPTVIPLEKTVCVIYTSTNNNHRQAVTLDAEKHRRALDVFPTTAGRVGIGSWDSVSASDGLEGYIMEAAIFSPALTDEQTNLLRAYLNNKWRIFQHGEA